jgi:Xaa-Pro aminopeptidase
MHNEQRARTCDLLDKRGIHRALFASLESVTWLTGFYHYLELGSSHFMGGPAMVWYADGHFTLIVLDVYRDLVASSDPDLSIVSYEGYTVEHPIESVHRLERALTTCFQSDKGTGPVGVELNYVPQIFIAALQRFFGERSDLIAIDGALVPSRMVKTDEELALLRDAFALTDIGHVAAQQATVVNNREIDVWVAVQTAINQHAGRNIPLGNDCVVTYRSPNNMGGPPRDYPIRVDTALIVDLSVNCKGYWSDSCATYYANPLTPEQTQLRQVVESALDFGASLLRPGVLASAIDQQVREFIKKSGYTVYPHHTGHAVGVSIHEEPRLVPYNHIPLAENMVIMLEPGIYFPGKTGVRLENAYRITRNGRELLTRHLLQTSS